MATNFPILKNFDLIISFYLSFLHQTNNTSYLVNWILCYLFHMLCLLSMFAFHSIHKKHLIIKFRIFQHLRWRSPVIWCFKTSIYNLVSVCCCDDSKIEHIVFRPFYASITSVTIRFTLSNCLYTRFCLIP